MKDSTNKKGIALIGCGTVGGAVARGLTQNKTHTMERSKIDLELRYIIDIDFSHAKELGLSSSLFCNDLDKALKDDSIDIVVELIGGTTIAKEFIERSIMAGKSIVTANKALLALHGNELISLAQKHNVSIAFEASCAGGIPIIRAIIDGLIANRIDAIYGIVNGTSNYILSAMTQSCLPYSLALKEAQAIGLAEADPTLDVAGIDSGHKLAILSSLAFGQKIFFEKIPIEGIDNLDICDIEYGKELGYIIKLLAISQRRKQGLSLYVRPAFISIKHPLSWVSGPFNAISVYGNLTGHTMYYGRGAGGDPTASAVIADLIQVSAGITDNFYKTLRVWPDSIEPALQMPREEIYSRYYIRVTVEDEPGVLAKLADKFGKHNISISSVLQKELPQENNIIQGVTVIITTHPAKEGSIIAALKEVDNLKEIKAESKCISILDEHTEQL